MGVASTVEGLAGCTETPTGGVSELTGCAELTQAELVSMGTGLAQARGRLAGVIFLGLACLGLKSAELFWICMGLGLPSIASLWRGGLLQEVL